MVRQTKEDLLAHLRDQIKFLQNSIRSYDEGFEGEARRMAVIIRVLAHDTPRSASLLGQLGKKNMLFYDTARQLNPKNLLPDNGLVVIRTGRQGGSFVPQVLAPAFPDVKVKKVPFDNWWNRVICKDSAGARFNRKLLALAVANKDGGAHIDPNLDEAYAKLSRFNSMGWRFFSDGIDQDWLSGPELPSLRQIAHEVLLSLQDEFPELFSG